MLTKNLAEKTFPLESYIRCGMARSVRRSNDSSCPHSQPRIPVMEAFTEK